MDYSGIAYICYMFDITPELKYQRNFSYFSNNPILIKSDKLSELNINAEPFICSSNSCNSCNSCNK